MTAIRAGIYDPWIEGRTIAIEYRLSEGRPERTAEIAAEFVRQTVNVIVTNEIGAVVDQKWCEPSLCAQS